MHDRALVRRLVPALGLAQVVSWGSLYYSIAVLGTSMRAELELSEAALFGAYSLSLLLSGVAAPWAGRTVDRLGGRAVLATGSAVAAVALFWIAHARSALEFYAAWALAGLAMAMTLYEAAFATLSQHTGTSYRTALTALTLMGGLASTVFWPASLIGLERFGWRDTMALFALLHLAVCLPLHLAFVPRGHPAEAPHGRADARRLDDGRPRAGRAAFVALSASFALNGFVSTALSVHLINLLLGKGFVLGTAVWVASLVGPMQVAGRLFEFSIGRRWPSTAIGIGALALTIGALLVLLALQSEVALALLFAGLYGCSNGIMTIVRGTVPAELFGRSGYGGLLGRILAPSTVAKAAAPVALASIAAPQEMPYLSLSILLVLAALSLGCFAAATRIAPGKIVE